MFIPKITFHDIRLGCVRVGVLRLVLCWMCFGVGLVLVLGWPGLAGLGWVIETYRDVFESYRS